MCVEVSVYIHASGHVFTTACLELHSVNVASAPTGQSWGFIGLILASMHVRIPFGGDGGATMTDFTSQET